MKLKDALRDEEAKLRRAQWERLSRSIQTRWARDGFNPRRHLAAVAGQGDGTVLNAFHWRERSASKTTLGTYLDRVDTNEIGDAIRASQRVLYPAGTPADHAYLAWKRGDAGASP